MWLMVVSKGQDLSCVCVGGGVGRWGTVKGHVKCGSRFTVYQAIKG